MFKPAPQEQVIWGTPTAEQTALCRAVLDETAAAVQKSQGEVRGGTYIGARSKLLQICDHPALYLQDGSPLPGRSGKLAALEALLAPRLARGEKAALSTQFVAMGKLLQQHLQARCGCPVWFVHSEMSVPVTFKHYDQFRWTAGAALLVFALQATVQSMELTRAPHLVFYDEVVPLTEAPGDRKTLEATLRTRVRLLPEGPQPQVYRLVTADTLEAAVETERTRPVPLKKPDLRKLLGLGVPTSTPLPTL